ncbi:MAG TPA: OmpA family protein [Polyangiaceae bacterium]|jgi:chemotaxis protein MotB|nr:OmpA family protein [Polyangiaceae bacterium]
MSGFFQRHVPIIAVCALASCVPKGKYDAAVADAKSAHAAADQASADAADAHKKIDELNEALKAAQELAEKRDQDLAQGQVSLHDLQTQLDDATAINQELKVELERLGKNADTLLSEKGSLSAALTEAKTRLEELRKGQAAADARAALFKQLVLKFQKMVDAGQLKITLRDGRMVIQLANDVLFDSGQTLLKPEGQKALAEVAAVLKTIPDRRFQVAGDTDNVPITSSRFRSNWDLSTARAVEVVHYLVKLGVPPGLLSAAGYGEFDPIAPNDTPASRSRNRRIEIVLQPNIDELVALPVAK